MEFSYDIIDYTHGFYQDLAPIRKCARPFMLVHPVKSDTAVLEIHGYAGYPGEMARPGIDLYKAGYDVYVPRLPGAGTSKEDFFKSKSSDWLGTARAALDDLFKKYGKVYIVGHSMGGAIGLILASEYKVERLVLFAPAILVNGLTPFKLAVASVFFKKIKTGWKPISGFEGSCERDPGDDAYLGQEYWSYIYPKMVLELNKIRKAGYAAINDVRGNTLTILGDKDPAIPFKVADIIKSKPYGINASLLIHDAGHLVLYEKNKVAQDQGIAAAVNWLTK